MFTKYLLIPFFLWIAFLPFEAPDAYPFLLVQNDIYTSFCLSLESLMFMGISHIYVIKFDFLLSICLMTS